MVSAFQRKKAHTYDIYRLACMGSIDLIQVCAHAQDLLGMDGYVRDLALQMKGICLPYICNRTY